VQLLIQDDDRREQTEQPDERQVRAVQLRAVAMLA
jgi:hypothetical protein